MEIKTVQYYRVLNYGLQIINLELYTTNFTQLLNYRTWNFIRRAVKRRLINLSHYCYVL